MNGNGSDDPLRKRLDVAYEVIKHLEDKIEQLKSEKAVLSAEKLQWDQSKILQDTIIRQSLESSNSKYQEQVLEIQRLRDRLKKYEGD